MIVQHEASCRNLEVQDLGRMSYEEALVIQREAQREVIDARERSPARSPMKLLLVEHTPPVITVSRRKSAAGHLLAGESALARAGIRVAETDRGGDITYHGPGQLVAYPIFDLNLLHLRLHGYMRLLEEVVIRVLARFSVSAFRETGVTGVWVPALGGRGASKICALGVRVSRWVTMHGLALNISTDLSHFEYIVPCGLVGRSVTSMEAILGARSPSMGEVQCVFIEEMHAAVSRSIDSGPAMTSTAGPAR